MTWMPKPTGCTPITWRRNEARHTWAPREAAEFTFAGDPMRLDYGYRRNGTRGFVQALSVSRAPADAKLLAYTVEHVRKKVNSAEFTAVTDVHLLAENERHRFVQETLRDAGVDTVPMEGFAVWTAKIRPTIQ